MRRIIYDGDSFYELDEECLKKNEEAERRKEMKWQERDPRTDRTRQKADDRGTNEARKESNDCGTDHARRQEKRRRR